jgi:hypothetical protein
MRHFFAASIFLVLAGPLAAQQSNQQTVWDVRNVTCKQILDLDDDDRAAAAMFYYGYLARDANLTVIDTAKIENNLKKVMDQCVKAPTSTMPDAFRESLTR